jgi:type VI protein secretion system component VasK
MAKPDVWHLVWVIVLILGGVLLAIGFVLAWLFRDVSELANFSSIWGICIALIGFALTIYTMIETQRASRKAQREVQTATVEAQQKIEEAARQAQEAVKQAHQQTQQARPYQVRGPRGELLDPSDVDEEPSPGHDAARLVEGVALLRGVPGSRREVGPGGRTLAQRA